MQPLFFVHIPKTAGTSFRRGAEHYFDKERIVYEYKKTSNTSQLVLDWLYGGQADPWRFKQRCEVENIAMVGGHVNIERYVSLLGICNTVTFLREPLQRIASDYQSFVLGHGYEGTFPEFYSKPAMQNRQSRALRNVTLESIGFLGLTENYAESLDMLNAHFDCDIAHRDHNRRRASLGASHQIRPEDEAELKRLNRKDLALYEQAGALFKIRLALFRKGLQYAHVRMGDVNTRFVAGSAWWAAGGDEPVDVEILVNGAYAAKVPATDFRPGLCRLHPPRGGYVGFRVPLELSPGDRVQGRVATTGQLFPAEPLEVPEPKPS